MAYASSRVTMISPGGGASLYRSTDRVGGVASWLCGPSSIATTEWTSTGYFTRAGHGSRALSSNQSDLIGMKKGDLVIVAQSTDGPDPGRVTIHSVIASTADQASTSAATGYVTGYNVSLSGS